MKKRTVTAAVICFLCVIALGIKTYEHNSQNAAALNVSEKVIIIDAGHGGEDGGAVGGDGTPEKELNLAVALKLQALLNRRYPGLCRKLDLRTERFNQHETPGSLLAEFGSTGNTLQEAIQAGRYFAEGLAELIEGV